MTILPHLVKAVPNTVQLRQCNVLKRVASRSFVWTLTQMPAFQLLASTGQKRKPDDDSLAARKKQTFESAGTAGSTNSSVQQYWMVQWYASTLSHQNRNILRHMWQEVPTNSKAQDLGR